MAVIIVEPVEAGAAWLAHALAGLDQRILRTASPDEAMGAIATEGREVLAALVGSGLDDEQALGLASRLQQAAPEVAVVLLRQRESGQILRAALRFGVRDVLAASSDGETVRSSVSRAIELATSLRGRLAAGPGGARPEAPGGRPGEIITVFSAKGGCGKTFLATNLAVALAAGGTEVALVDLDLHFGDVAIVLQLFPTRTIQDAARERGLDARTLRSYLTPHHAGVWALAAPTEPPVADTVSASAVSTLLKLLRSSFAYVVVDTPAAVTDQVLAAFDESDAIALLATLDVPSIKNLKLTMQTMERLRYPPSRIRVIVNRADSRVGLRLPDVEKVLGTSVDLTIPSSRSVPISVNTGNLVLLEEPRGNVADALGRRAARRRGRGRPARPLPQGLGRAGARPVLRAAGRPARPRGGSRQGARRLPLQHPHPAVRHVAAVVHAGRFGHGGRHRGHPRHPPRRPCAGPGPIRAAARARGTAHGSRAARPRARAPLPPYRAPTRRRARTPARGGAAAAGRGGAGTAGRAGGGARGTFRASGAGRAGACSAPDRVGTGGAWRGRVGRSAGAGGERRRQGRGLELAAPPLPAARGAGREPWRAHPADARRPAGAGRQRRRPEPPPRSRSCPTRPRPSPAGSLSGWEPTPSRCCSTTTAVCSRSPAGSASPPASASFRWSTGTRSCSSCSASASASSRTPSVSAR